MTLAKLAGDIATDAPAFLLAERSTSAKYIIHSPSPARKLLEQYLMDSVRVTFAILSNESVL